MASTSGRDDAALIEGQLSWLVHILGAITQGRMSNNLGESQVRAGCGWAMSST